MNRSPVIIGLLITVSLFTVLLSCGCTGGTANVHLDNAYTLVSADDENLTADFDVVVTAVNTGNVKARDLVVLVTMQQLVPGETWGDQVAGSDMASATISLGTIAPGASKTGTVTITLQGREESFALLREGAGIEVMTEVEQLNYYTSSWLDFF